MHCYSILGTARHRCASAPGNTRIRLGLRRRHRSASALFLASRASLRCLIIFLRAAYCCKILFTSQPGTRPRNRPPGQSFKAPDRLCIVIILVPAQIRHSLGVSPPHLSPLQQSQSTRIQLRYPGHLPGFHATTPDTISISLLPGLAVTAVKPCAAPAASGWHAARTRRR